MNLALETFHSLVRYLQIILYFVMYICFSAFLTILMFIFLVWVAVAARARKIR